jgi:hypothetical protein
MALGLLQAAPNFTLKGREVDRDAGYKKGKTARSTGLVYGKKL